MKRYRIIPHSYGKSCDSGYMSLDRISWWPQAEKLLPHGYSHCIDDTDETGLSFGIFTELTGGELTLFVLGMSDHHDQLYIFDAPVTESLSDWQLIGVAI